MDLSIAGLVFAAAAIHPFRELLLKGNPYPESAYFGVVVAWLGIVTVHGLLSGADFASAAEVWHLILFSALGLCFYYLGIPVAMREGDLSVYYPIIRAAPVFIVVVGWLVLGQSYGPVMLLGVALVTGGAFLLQYRPGARLLDSRAALAASLLAMAGMGTQSLADAEAMRRIEPTVLLFWQYLLVMPVCAYYLSLGRPAGRGLAKHLLAGWRAMPFRYLAAAGSSYVSYYLILTAYQWGGNVAAVNCLRQVSIPLSVLLGGLLLDEVETRSRLAWSLVLAAGVVVIILAR